MHTGYCTQNYWAPPPVLYSRNYKKHDVSETESVSAIKWGGGGAEDTYSVGSFRES
jgi:hypothetical protein